jgi:hypothetical protein
MVYLGSVTTTRKFNAARAGDPPPTNRVALHNPSPREISDRCEAMMKEYKQKIKNVKQELKEKQAQDDAKELSKETEN